jgi:mannose-1-phosphate guanylyltransferase
MRYAMIMAGGAGTRLWPMSRESTPKQLLEFITPGSSALTATLGEAGGKPLSLLEIAARRVEGLIPPERRYICTAERFRGAIRAALPAFGDAQVLGEPAARDTVNAVGFAAAVFQKLDKDATFIVLTADHLIAPEKTFRERAELGFALVEQDPRRLVTFSIKPTYAATGFGYVERGAAIPVPAGAKGAGAVGAAGGGGVAFKVARFVEKPDGPRAQAYFESGHFGWNSGMFVLHAGTFMDCLARFKPESHEGLVKIQEAWGTSRQREVLEAVYPTLPRISVDYAVMEPASRDTKVSVCTITTDVDWLDVGSWPSFGQTIDPDGQGNRVGGAGAGDVVHLDTGESLIVNAEAGHAVGVLGMRDVIVVHTKDATLVMPRSQAENLKKLHGLVRAELK